MRALPEFDASLWVRELQQSQALCRQRPDLPWTGDATPRPPQMGAMRGVCEQCPIRRDCASFALNARSGRGVDGGYYAGAWWPWIDQHEPGAYTRRGARKYLTDLIPLLDYRVMMERLAQEKV